MHNTSDGTFWGILGGLKVGDSWSMGLFLEVEVERKKRLCASPWSSALELKLGSGQSMGLFWGSWGDLKQERIGLWDFLGGGDENWGRMKS